MDYFAHVSAFVEKVKRVSSEIELTALLDEVLGQIGFQHYALVSHVDLVDLPHGAVRILKYPPSWVQHNKYMKYYVDDPVLTVAKKIPVPFMWRDVDDYIDLSKRQLQIFSEAKEVGLVTGFTVPFHVPGTISGSCTFASDEKALHPDSLPILHYIASYSFSTAMRLAVRAIL